MTTKKASGKETLAKKITELTEAMEQPLRDKCEEARQLLADDDRNTVESRYKLGLIVVEIQEAGTYGAKAVQQFAHVLGLNKATVYDYAAVTETWDEKAVDELKERKGVFGRPVSFSHLIELSKVKRGAKRESLIESVLAEGLSVSELRERIKRESPASKGGAKKGLTMGASLRMLVRRADSLLETMKASEGEVFFVIEKASGQSLDDKTIGLLEQAKTNHQRLLDACASNMKRLDAALAKARETAEEEQKEDAA